MKIKFYEIGVDGSLTAHVHGHIRVTSNYAPGARDTRFTITMDQDHNVSWKKYDKSRVPCADDVLAALWDILDETPYDERDKDETVKLWKNTAGAVYYTLKGHSLGISPEGKLSLAGAENIPASTLKTLMAYI